MAQQDYGMFGPMPYEIQQMQQLQAEKQAMGYAQLNAEQMASYQSSLGGRAIGQGIAGIFGGEDPAVKRAKQLQAISKEVQQSGIDPNNYEEFYTKLGTKLAEAGMTSEAANVANMLQSYKDKKYDTETKKYNAETARIKAEAFKSSKLRSNVSQEIFKKNKEYSPDSLQAYLKSITDENPDGDLSVLKPYKDEKGWNTDGFTPDKKFVFTNDQGQVAINDPETGKLVPYNGPIESSTKDSKTNVDVRVGAPQVEYKVTNEAPKPGMSPADEKAQDALVTPRAKKFAEAQAAMESLGPTVQQAIKTVNSGDYAWGSGAGMQTELLRLKSTVGKWIGVKTDDTTLNNTDTLKMYTARAILPLLAQIGGNDSNEEMKQMMAAVGDNAMTPAQFKRAIEITQKEMKTWTDRQKAYSKGIESGRTDHATFFANNYQWKSGEPVKYQTEKGGEQKEETKIKGGEQPVRDAAARGPVTSNKVKTLMQKYPGMTEAEANVILQGKK